MMVMQNIVSQQWSDTEELLIQDYEFSNLY